MLRSMLTMVLLIGAAGCATSPVPDAATAIHFAREGWLRQHPELKGGAPSEHNRQSTMTASLKDGVWTVEDRPTSLSQIGGGAIFLVRARDGRLLETIIVQ